MAKRGKDLQIGGGSRRPSQARAEDAARRSQKRADERRWRREEEGRRTADVALPERSTTVAAIVDLYCAAWVFGLALEEMTLRTEGLFR